MEECDQLRTCLTEWVGKLANPIISDEMYGKLLKECCRIVLRLRRITETVPDVDDHCKLHCRDSRTNAWMKKPSSSWILNPNGK